MMRFFTLLLSVLIVGSLNAQVIWGGPGDANGEFDGGLNDWTTSGTSGGVFDEDAVWVWEADGAADAGAFSGAASVIISPSVGNGAAVFDSDFLDNNGVGDFGNGPAPAPQVGELISPYFSTEGFDNVSISWHQYTRNFQSSYEVHVTADSGATWTVYPLVKNNDVSLNFGTDQDNQRLLNITDAAANQASVQFKFVFNANYYNWIIDDVAVISSPVNNLEADLFLWPVNAYSIPAHMINADSMEFELNVINRGLAASTGGTATASIINGDGTAVYSLTQDFGAIEVGDTLAVVWDSYVLPEDLVMDEGVYSVLYEVAGNEGVDFPYTATNENGAPLIISTDNYRLNRGSNGGVAFGDGSQYTAVQIMRTGELPDNMEYVATNLLTGGVSNTGSEVNSILEVVVLKVENQLSDEIDPVFESDLLGDDLDDPHPNLELVGYGLTNTETFPNFGNVEAELVDADFEPQIILEENTTYLVGVSFNSVNDPGGFVFITSVDNMNYFQTAQLVHDPSFGWGTPAPSTIFEIETTVTTRTTDNANETELPEDAIRVFPSPAVDFTNVELNFDVPTDAAIILRNMNGAYIATKSVENATKENVQFDVTSLPAGNYSFEITTSEGARSIKSFVITK